MSNGVFLIKKVAYLPDFNKSLIEMTRCFFVFERSRQKTFRFRSRSRLRLNKSSNVLKPSRFVMTIDTSFVSFSTRWYRDRGQDRDRDSLDLDLDFSRPLRPPCLVKRLVKTRFGGLNDFSQSLYLQGLVSKWWNFDMDKKSLQKV
jgi:hypothetical protein